MRFLVDAQLPPSLAALLREQGHEAVHIFDILPTDTQDNAIWLAALGNEYILVTKDEDFAEWSRLREPHPPILWLRFGNLKKSALQTRMLPLLPELVERLQRGETLIEVF